VGVSGITEKAHKEFPRTVYLAGGRWPRAGRLRSAAESAANVTSRHSCSWKAYRTDFGRATRSKVTVRMQDLRRPPLELCCVIVRLVGRGVVCEALRNGAAGGSAAAVAVQFCAKAAKSLWRQTIVLRGTAQQCCSSDRCEKLHKISMRRMQQAGCAVNPPNRQKTK